MLALLRFKWRRDAARNAPIVAPYGYWYVDDVVAYVSAGGLVVENLTDRDVEFSARWDAVMHETTVERC